MGFKINFFFQNVLLDMTLSMKPIQSSASCRWYVYSGGSLFSERKFDIWLIYDKYTAEKP